MARVSGTLALKVGALRRGKTVGLDDSNRMPAGLRHARRIAARWLQVYKFMILDYILCSSFQHNNYRMRKRIKVRENAYAVCVHACVCVCVHLFASFKVSSIFFQ